MRTSNTDLTSGAGQWRGFGASATAAGLTPHVSVLHVGEVPAPPAVADRLDVEPGTTVLERRRLHSVERGDVITPMEIATTWITMGAVGDAPQVQDRDTGPGGITSRLEEAGYVLRYAEEVSARHPDTSERLLLNVDGDDPLVEVVRWTFGRRARPRPDGDVGDVVVDTAETVVKVSVRLMPPGRHRPVFRHS